MASCEFGWHDTDEGPKVDEDDCNYEYDFLVDVLCKVSTRFKRLAMDSSLWEGLVVIGADKNPEKFEFVVQECLHSGTLDFLVCGELKDFFPVLTSPRYNEFLNPTKRFHNLKLSEFESDQVVWSDVRYNVDASIRATA